MHLREIPFGACPRHRWLAGCDVNRIGEIGRALVIAGRMAESKPSTLTRSLTHNHNPRQHLEAWLIETETIARNLCPQHATGALILVATDVVWQQMPIVVVDKSTHTVRSGVD